MPKVAKEATTAIKNSELKEAEKPVEYEVCDAMKSHGSIMLGTHFIPIVDGKVKISAKTKEIFDKSGFLK